MPWSIRFCPEFLADFDGLDERVQDELLGQLRVLEHRGPALGRPRVDTLKGSRHRNMKELRFDVQSGVWRVAFAFDPKRCAIVLVAGDKTGVSQQRFYRNLIRHADERFARYLSGGVGHVENT
ncbi:type II toxin-antitoxin system RelE/ParE family toxin [Pseudomonas rubra]|uniref:Type II toxin-antitoxin system RelE/ParE family toxin n=1 Tax=Pseudomonas rubra TaxID=2942627 RepID=A0ABT5P4Y9_9PSED|nr:type II toxin-antitoxin system RelE/ParE family toxin [Pseudomonas rubra]MDD1013251.1 type II toxin-antitoxin system RelE/ParE family toxin [Pseudomonas rubra]MDD1037536.1 type II toxin-antitoxin system RelE/ParE family toxin [Pseudomonas rubra]MDD1155576.1 type II toxin-antitoxin system RelE/ParE family toxin [Pseudomonas rubra]